MKRNIFKAFVAVAVLALASCSMFNRVEKDDSGTNTKQAYITISLNENNRTELPRVSGADDFDCFKLTGFIKPENDTITPVPTEYGTWTTDSTNTAYEKMTDAKIAVTTEETYSFTLTATKGGATWQGEIEKTIQTGTNSLSFTLALTGLSDEGTGSLTITLSVPEIVKAVDAELKTMDETQTVTPSNAAFSFANGKAAYTASDIEAGSYVLVFTLWGDAEKTLKLNQWREYAGIANGLTSSSNPVIAKAEEVGEIYQLTLNLNGGELRNNFTVPGSYTRFSGNIALPENAIRMTENGILSHPDAAEDFEIYRKNYLFEGWYDKETGGNLVEKIPSGSTENVTLWAHWTDTFTVAVDDMITQANVDGFGGYLETSLKYFQEQGFDCITLKLTDMADLSTQPSVEEMISNIFTQASYADSRYTAIIKAICAVQGEITTNNKDKETGFYKFTYTGLGVNLDLSETTLSYLPSFYATSELLNYELVNLIGITLPETLKVMPINTFNYMGFTEITIPKSVSYIEDACFANTQGLTINFENGSSISTIGQIAVGLDDVVAINIPASVTTIESEVFSKSNLERITFDEGSKLETIGEKAFYYCLKLKEIELPEGVTCIKNETFSLCNSLEKITIPSSVTSIKYAALAGCINLTSIKYSGTKSQWAAVDRGELWNNGVPSTTKVTCTDGEVDMDYGFYSITVENGTSTPKKIISGKTVTVYADTPETGYAFDKWTTSSEDVVFADASATETTFTMPAHDVSITATYKDILYNITLPTDGNGTVTSSATNGTATYGTEVTLTIEPETGYALASISVTAGDETVTLNGTGNTRTFTMPAHDVSISATWSTVSGITVNVASNSTIGITKTENDTSITLTAEEGFDTNSYAWMIDGELAQYVTGASVSENGIILTIQKATCYEVCLRTNGYLNASEETVIIDGEVHQISLVATKRNIPYGAQISVIVNNPKIRVDIYEDIDTLTDPLFNKTVNIETINFCAEYNFTNYIWSINGNEITSSGDGIKLSDNGMILTLQKSMFANSSPDTSFLFSLSATKNGVPYNAQITLYIDSSNSPN